MVRECIPSLTRNEGQRSLSLGVPAEDGPRRSMKICEDFVEAETFVAAWDTISPDNQMIEPNDGPSGLLPSSSRNLRVFVAQFVVS